MMKTVLKHIVALTYKPLLVKYLSKIRIYTYENIQLEISPEVFHPGFFFSTKLLLKYIKQLSLRGKRLLEPGCGSGLISIYTAREGAIVTATDINPVALEFLKKNSRMNAVDLTIIHSDLFKNVPKQQFDVVAINPPYYKKEPLTPRDYAWHCGENGEYFTKLFTGLNDYTHPGSEVYMVLFDGCDTAMIEKIAADNNFTMRCVLTTENLLEKNFIFKIEPAR